MCAGCWAEYGFPLLKTPKVLAMADVIKRVDPYGNLHIVVDDWNIDDDNIRWCAEEHAAGRNNGNPWSPDEVECIGMMEAASLDERASAMAHADGYDEKLRDELQAISR
jgi:hypothetical protein